MANQGRYRIQLDKEWSLEDLYVFPRAFEQTYFFLASLDQALNDVDRGKLEFAYKAFPWQGGYSAVNFFNHLKFATPRKNRPAIVAIYKASTGYFDLQLWITTAISVAVLVKAIASSINTTNTVYHNVYKGMQERKLLKLRVKREKFEFEREHIEFIKTSCQDMSKILGFTTPTALNKLTGSPYTTVKILLSVYRRVRKLAEYENKGKAYFPEEEFNLPISPPPHQRARRFNVRSKK